MMMSNKDKAAIAVNYLADNLFDECNRLVSTVPVVEIKGLDPEFSNPFGAALLFAGIWSGDYWHCAALCLTCLVKYQAKNDYGEVDVIQTAKEHSYLESRWLATYEAMEFICETYGLFPGSVCKMANDAHRPIPIRAVCSDSAYKEQLIDHYVLMMGAWLGNKQQKSLPLN